MFLPVVYLALSPPRAQAYLADLPEDLFLEDGEEQYDVIATLGDEFLGPEPARNNYQPLTPRMPQMSFENNALTLRLPPRPSSAATMDDADEAFDNLLDWLYFDPQRDTAHRCGGGRKAVSRGVCLFVCLRLFVF